MRPLTGVSTLRSRPHTIRGVSKRGKPSIHIFFGHTEPKAPAVGAPNPSRRARSSIGSRSSSGATRRTHASSRDGPSDDDPGEPEPPSWWRNTADDLPAGFLDDEEAYR